MLVVGMGGGGGQRYFVPLCCQVLEMKKQEKASIALWFGVTILFYHQLNSM